ncbi:hypothetical protein DVH24_001979 [Malus domestica]|uniref:Zinc knuckle CX2CX4HX4C domain-containing protein n=1 Tax=Malus domestica TaxID=3750 RepID=A0A498IA90_MALDO|nr:hypothetical protein DVH24_001979 [Malus domestica]
MEDTSKPLVTGCWLPQEDNMETWVEFRYERLQDFCYKCGRICHVLNECFFAQAPGSVAGYGEWTKVAPIRDMSNTSRPITLGGPSSVVIEEIQVEHGQHNDELATIHMRTYVVVQNTNCE